ncbi:NAD-dependent protein deacylase SRT2 [Camellia lanceoleosa]|uniref:NAD-dependent protein deacylase SRT2 n=1 Tax=Camellia lanceoleosa TaxID=1840588 RepID=A0ACC0FH63_9ERIC|nr:NAD-dependent protein deacylase SRT2 [Camellia lanceoleosa]
MGCQMKFYYEHIDCQRCEGNAWDYNERYASVNTKLVVLTRAGINTKCGIPDYRSPNGAYSSGFRPITHKEFLYLTWARRRYWVKSYAGWRRFTTAQPGLAHIALLSLEKTSRINFMITQNVDRLHHSAGNNPLELHLTIYNVVCIDCSFRCYCQLFEDQLKALNPKYNFASSCSEDLELNYDDIVLRLTEENPT